MCRSALHVSYSRRVNIIALPSGYRPFPSGSGNAILLMLVLSTGNVLTGNFVTAYALSRTSMHLIRTIRFRMNTSVGT